MTDEMKKLVEEALRLILTGLEKGSNFAGEQIPLVVQEKLTYDFYYYMFFTGLYTLMAVAGFIWCFCWVKAYFKNAYYDNEWKLFLGIVPCVLVTLLWLVALGSNIPLMIQIHVAPRLYILEWLRGVSR